jgi:hypothetical protein
LQPCDLAERGQRHNAGVREQDVEAARLLLHRSEQPVEVREARDVALHAGDVPADLRYRFIEFRLPASGDGDVGALRGDHDDGPDALEMALRLSIDLWNGRFQQPVSRLIA